MGCWVRECQGGERRRVKQRGAEVREQSQGGGRVSSVEREATVSQKSRKETFASRGKMNSQPDQAFGANNQEPAAGLGKVAQFREKSSWTRAVCLPQCSVAVKGHHDHSNS